MLRSESDPSSPGKTHQLHRLTVLAGVLFRWPGFEVAGVWGLVGMPLIVVGGHLLSPNRPEVLSTGDEAALELFVYHAYEGVQLEGHCSHNVFRNAGPLQFYLTLPLYVLTGCRFEGVMLTAIVINLASMAGVLAVIRSFGGRKGLVWSALLLMLYFRWLDTVELVTSWPAVVTVMPFTLSLMLFTAAATGRRYCFPIAVGVSSYVAQTYVAYIPALAIAAVFSLLLCALPKLSSWLGMRAPVSGKLSKALLISLVVLAILWALPAIREMTAPSSDIAQMTSYFAKHGIRHSWKEMVVVRTRVLSCFPIGSITGGLRVVWPGDVEMIHVAVAGAQLLLLPVVYYLARRFRRDFEVVLCVLCVALLGAMTVSIQCIVGPIYAHMVSWMTCLSVLILIAAGGVVLPWLATCLRIDVHPLRRHAVGVAAWAALVFCCVLNVKETVDQIPNMRNDRSSLCGIKRLATASRQLLQREHVRHHLVRIVDHDVWLNAAGLILELTKAGTTPAVDERWLLMFGSQHAPAEHLDGVLFCCHPESSERLRQGGGLEWVAQTPEIALFWRPVGMKVEGRHSFGDLGLFAETFQGFWAAEGRGDDAFRWSKGSQSSITVGLEKGRAYRLTLCVAPLPLADRKQGITVLLGDRRIAYRELHRPDWQQIEVVLPARYVEDLNTIVFRYRYTESPPRNRIRLDIREMAVQFKSITFRRLDE